MIDIHTHILPGIDDGSSSMEDSIEMAELAYESGVRIIVATPHCNIDGVFENYYTAEWRELFQQFKRELKEEGIPIDLIKGMEIYASEDVAEKILEGRLIPIHNSRYYLIEFPFDADPYWMGDILESVLSINKVPVIAHPERYYCIQDHPGILYEWMRKGCLSQLNKGSVFGRFGRHAARSAEVLLEHNLVTCIASDAHSLYRRTTYMADIKEFMEDHFGREMAKKLLYHNAHSIIRDLTIDHSNIIRPVSRRWY